jgi:hypothetical protein
MSATVLKLAGDHAISDVRLGGVLCVLAIVVRTSIRHPVMDSFVKVSFIVPFCEIVVGVNVRGFRWDGRDSRLSAL